MSVVRQIVVVDYRPEWSREFAALARALEEALGDLALRIDHIGSTSVPGLAAKDIIDMQVTVRHLTPELDAAFARAGYLRRADITRDHRPPTATGPDEDWAKLYYPAGPRRAPGERPRAPRRQRERALRAALP